MSDDPLCFEQLHIDVARNSTDDFNPFHDPRRWQGIRGNPFGSTIALGFQMEMLAADRVATHRGRSDRCPDPTDEGPHYSNFEFQFARPLLAGEPFRVDVKRTVATPDGAKTSNRVILRADDGALVLRGTLSETAEPRFLHDETPRGLPSLEHLPDRIRVPGTPYFAKRKYMNTSNAKNFLVGSLCNQHDYFDELDERICFPPLFTVSLLSCALLERGWAEGYDFEADPVVYTHHRISVDNRLQRQVRSNDVLYLLVQGPLPVESPVGRGEDGAAPQRYHCFGLLHGRDLLFRASVGLLPLRGFTRAPG
jgi:hypothetical protein